MRGDRTERECRREMKERERIKEERDEKGERK